MFSSLFKLYRHNSKKVPLEDFTTELLAGVLQNDRKLCAAICTQVFGMQEAKVYQISTQVFYPLKEYED